MSHGQYDWRDLVELHKPPDVAAQILQMHRQGLKTHDIADALGLGTGAVLQVLRENAILSTNESPS